MASCSNNSGFDDQFNNPANNYVYPALSPCAGTGNDSNLEFIDDGLGIVSGSEILAKNDFSDISIPVSSYTTESKILSEGEIIYVPGLTKGLTQKRQGFEMPALVSTDETLNSLFLTADLSINYYKNFKYIYDSVDVSANYGQNINIEDALNIALAGKAIRVTATYDPSTLSFQGNIDGYEFIVDNIILGVIDTSENSLSPFSHLTNDSSYILEEDPSLYIPYAKYPNGAMQGIVMKGIYPADTPSCPYDHWLKIHHVSNIVSIYEPVEIDSSTYYEKVEKTVDVGMNGSSTETVMSAGDYLEWITTNDDWNKFGDMYIWTTSPDACDTCYNLINGFYIYNPHAFNIKIEYMLIV